MVSNKEICASAKLSLKCPKCGTEVFNDYKFCDKCGKRLLFDVNSQLSEDNASAEGILGRILWHKFLTSIVEVQYGSLVFTTNRILVADTVYTKSMIKWNAMKKSEKIHKELSNMKPDEIFSSDMWPCQSIPYSQIEKIKVKKGNLNPGYVKITTGEEEYQYLIQPSSNSTRKLGFVHDLEPILGDKIDFRRY